MSFDSSPRIRPASGRGARICRRITRRYAKTFYFASNCLPRDVRADAYAIYGFCRWADNAVDDAKDQSEATRRLNFARETLDLVYSRRPAAPGLAEFRATVQTRGLPRELFDELLDGMEMDLTITRYADFAALEIYCRRAAGVVGSMMSYVFGFDDPCCLANADALGKAMQLTNILRDVAEDFDRGRIYLPMDELARFGVTEDHLRSRVVDENFRALVRFQIVRARRFYADSEPGIRHLKGDAARLTVRVMSKLYAGILDAIERQDLDVQRARAFVPLPKKFRLLAGCQIDTLRDHWMRFWI